MENKQGTIKNYVDLKFKIGTKTFTEQLMVTGLGKQKIILGFTWLNKHNPIINWKNGRIEWQYFLSKKGIKRTRKSLGLKPKSLNNHPIKKIIPKPSITEEKDEEEHKN